AWDRALASTAAIFRTCAERGISLAIVNLGGGFPARYVRKTPKLESYGKAIFKALRKHFGNNLPNTFVEPGRGLVGNAGIIEAEVVLIAKRSPEDEVRWVYLDIGKFHGLAETIGESIPYPIRTPQPPTATCRQHPRLPPCPFRPVTRSLASRRTPPTRCRFAPRSGTKSSSRRPAPIPPPIRRSVSTAIPRCDNM